MASTGPEHVGVGDGSNKTLPDGETIPVPTPTRAMVAYWNKFRVPKTSPVSETPTVLDSSSSIATVPPAPLLPDNQLGDSSVMQMADLASQPEVLVGPSAEAPVESPQPPLAPVTSEPLEPAPVATPAVADQPSLAVITPPSEPLPTEVLPVAATPTPAQATPALEPAVVAAPAVISQPLPNAVITPPPEPLPTEVPPVVPTPTPAAAPAQAPSASPNPETPSPATLPMATPASVTAALTRATTVDLAGNGFQEIVATTPSIVATGDISRYVPGYVPPQPSVENTQVVAPGPTAPPQAVAPSQDAVVVTS